MSKGIAAYAAVPFTFCALPNCPALNSGPSSLGNRYGIQVSFRKTEGDKAMAKSSKKSDPFAQWKDTMDGLTRAAMRKERLAAGFAAAAAAISEGPAARRKIRDAGLDAADSASQAATNVMSS